MPDVEPLDIENADALVAYLRDTGRIGPRETPGVRVLAGGVSNKTVLVECEAGEAWVLKQALPKLRVAADWFSDPARVRREAAGLRWLPRFAPAGSITPLVFEDPEKFLLAMVAVPKPHENWKTVLLGGRVEDDHVGQFGRMLAEIHRLSAEAGAEVRTAFADRSFFETLRLEPYYAYAAVQVPEAGRFLHELIDRTRERRLTLVHGDYSPKNVLIHEERLILLDHEVIHFGDPAFDIGFALTHLLSKSNHLSDHREQFARAAALFWKTYADIVVGAYWTDDLEQQSIRHTLGCLLARVAGRSPLEYLDPRARSRQQQFALTLMKEPPAGVEEMIRRFAKRLNDAA